MFNAFEVRECRKECNKELVAKHIVNSLQIDRRYMKELIETSKLARNYFIHDINAIPEPQEVLRLLTGAVDLALKYQAIISKSINKNSE